MAVQQFPVNAGAINVTAGTVSQTNLSGVQFSNSNSVSFGISGSTITASVGAPASPVNFSAGAASANLGSVVFSNSNSVSFGLNGSTITANIPAFLTTAALSGDTSKYVQNWALNGNNTAGTTSSAQGVSLFLSGGNMMTLSGNSNTIVMSVNSASLLGTGATASFRFTSADTQLRFTSADTQLRFTSADSQLVFTSATSSQRTFLSSYENMNNGVNNAVTMTLNGASQSQAVAFNIPQFVSASFMRIPALMTLQSTSVGVVATSNLTASGGWSSTWNAVVYSVGAGANSKSLQSVTSSSNQWSFSAKISVSNSSQGSYTMGYSANAEGVGTSLSTQYSTTDVASYQFSTTQFSNFSGNRMLDIQWANSLTPGNYWMVFGYSSASASGGPAALAGITNVFIKYSNHYGISMGDLSFGVINATNQTSGGLLGAGFFSTAGGGTTNSIPISAISSSASNVKPYFQFLRSA